MQISFVLSWSVCSDIIDISSYSVLYITIAKSIREQMKQTNKIIETIKYHSNSFISSSLAKRKMHPLCLRRRPSHTRLTQERSPLQATAASVYVANISPVFSFTTGGCTTGLPRFEYLVIDNNLLLVKNIFDFANCVYRKFITIETSST